MGDSLFPNLTVNAFKGPSFIGVGARVLFSIFVIELGTSTPREECYQPFINFNLLHVSLGKYLLVGVGCQRISRPFSILVSVVPW